MATISTPSPVDLILALLELPNYVKATAADYDAAWDWFCQKCGTEWLDDDQVMLFEAFYKVGNG